MSRLPGPLVDRLLNSHYYVLSKNPRDKLQVLTLAKQVYPGGTDFFLKQYERAVRRPYEYLLIDLKTTTQNDCRLRTNVLPGEEGFKVAQNSFQYFPRRRF